MATRRDELGEELDGQVKQILKIMGGLQDAGEEAIIAALGSELTDAKKQALLAQLRGLASKTDEEIKQWLVGALGAVYVDGLNVADTLLKKFNIKTAAGKITVEILRSSPDLAPHLAAANALISDAYMDFGSGLTGWVKGNEHILNDIIKKQIQSQLATGRLTGESVDAIRKELVKALKAQGVEALLDRGGRQWTLERYAEMLTRTHLIKANTEATTNRVAQFGVDIVEVSTHGADDDICAPEEGQLYSISGNSANYPPLDGHEPPFHPNCKHTLLPRPDLE